VENGRLVDVLALVTGVAAMVSFILGTALLRALRKKDLRQDAPRSTISRVGRSSTDDCGCVWCVTKIRALELEWEDTRAKFLGMTRSFIRQARAAGLDGSGDGSTLPVRNTPGAAQLELSSRAAGMTRSQILAEYRRKTNATAQS